MSGTYGRRAAIAMALILCVVWAGYVTARLAVSDFYAQTVSREIESWSQPGHKFRGDELPRAIKSIKRSLDFSPTSAWALEQMGALKLGEVRSATDPQLGVAAARAAYASFKSSLLQRPTSPFAWSNLARAKVHLGEIDAEVFDALARTAELGPWEPQPQLNALIAGLAAWGKANEVQREMILGIRDRAAVRSADKVTEIAKSFSRPELGCDKIAQNAKGGRPCPRKPS